VGIDDRGLVVGQWLIPPCWLVQLAKDAGLTLIHFQHLVYSKYDNEGRPSGVSINPELPKIVEFTFDKGAGEGEEKVYKPEERVRVYQRNSGVEKGARGLGKGSRAKTSR
jgi:hypothetical protein